MSRSPQSPLPLFPLPVASLPIVGRSETFPVGRILCVGRNYAAHAQEMGASGSEPPFFFMKSTNSLWDIEGAQGCWPYPTGTHDCHHELEIVLAMGPGGNTGDAEVWGLALGLDMTRRDRQAEMKSAGKPWEVGKAFPAAAPTTPITALADLGIAPDPSAVRSALEATELRLMVGSELRQSGSPRQMLCPIPELLCAIRTEFGLQAGDLIFTGTPSGVGPVHPGDGLRGELLAPDGRALIPALRLEVLAAAI